MRAGDGHARIPAGRCVVVLWKKESEIVSFLVLLSFLIVIRK